MPPAPEGAGYARLDQSATGGMYIYIYIYIDREREERERKDINMYVGLMCVFIHTNSQVDVYYIVHTHKVIKNRPHML